MPVQRVEIEKINNFAAPYAVNGIADYAADDDEQRIVTLIPAFGKPAHKEEGSDNNDNCNSQKKPPVAVHDAPGGAFIGNKCKIKKAGNNRDPLTTGNIMFDRDLGHLIYQNQQACQSCRVKQNFFFVRAARIRFFKKSTQGLDLFRRFSREQ